MWCRVKPWYPRWHRFLVTLAIVIPVLSLSGYVSAGFELLEELHRDHMLAEILKDAHFDPDKAAALLQWQPWLTGLFVALPVLFVGARIVETRLRALSEASLILEDGTKLRIHRGATVLETLREARRPHAAVCGGRGRCTTCRVRVLQGRENLAPPDPLEAKALNRIKALDGVRLACQIRPTKTLGISALLPSTATARDGQTAGGLDGHEQKVTTIFIDIRGSTRMAEEKLPYDVLFILNQFFSEMSRAIAETGGHYAQFNGDGLMALYGLSGNVEAGAKAALAGAAAMIRRLEKLNETLSSELPFPLQAGIGIHHGDAIVGLMGPPDARLTSAIGDTINIAARLESLTKEHGVPVIVSLTTAEAAGLAVSSLTLAETQVRGREEPVPYYLVPDPSLLTTPEPGSV